MTMLELRREYHRLVCQQIMYVSGEGIPKLADKDSQASVRIARALIQRLHYPLAPEPLAEQKIGAIFEQRTREFLRTSFAMLRHLRPGKWQFEIDSADDQPPKSGRAASTRRRVPISSFDQYRHLANLSVLLKKSPDLAAILGRTRLRVSLCLARASRGGGGGWDARAARTAYRHDRRPALARHQRSPVRPCHLMLHLWAQRNL